jgi:hypothetical protein
MGRGEGRPCEKSWTGWLLYWLQGCGEHHEVVLLFWLLLWWLC